MRRTAIPAKRGGLIVVAAFLMVVVLVLGAIRRGTQDAGRPEAGRWTGDVTVGGERAGVHWEVWELSREPRLRLLGTPAHGLGAIEMQGFRATADGVQFTWPGAVRRLDRRCDLRRRAGGEFAGECTRAGEAEFGVRMVPPSAGNPPVGLAAKLLSEAGAWQSLRRGSVHVHVPASQAGEVDAAALAASAAARLTEGLEFLGEPAFERPLHVFAVADRAAMAALVGQGAGGWADPMAATVAVTGYGASARTLRHEIVHVLAAQLWGVPAAPDTWLQEGLATLSMESCGGHAIDDIVRYLHATGRLPAFGQLLTEFGAHDDFITYLQSASIVDYILREYGHAGVRRVWRRGVHAALAELGVSGASVLEAAWLARLVAVAPGLTDAGFEALRSTGCAQADPSAQHVRALARIQPTVRPDASRGPLHDPPSPR